MNIFILKRKSNWKSKFCRINQKEPNICWKEIKIVQCLYVNTRKICSFCFFKYIYMCSFWFPLQNVSVWFSSSKNIWHLSLFPDERENTVVEDACWMLPWLPRSVTPHITPSSLPPPPNLNHTISVFRAWPIFSHHHRGDSWRFKVPRLYSFLPPLALSF